MSIRRDKIQSLLGVDVKYLNQEDLKTSSRDLLESGMHGICFSPYEGSQKP
jgi:glucan 1,3-beta-glucosidase